MAKTQEELAEDLSILSTELMDLATADTIVPITKILLKIVQWGSDCVETGCRLTADGIKEVVDKRLAEQRAEQKAKDN